MFYNDGIYTEPVMSAARPTNDCLRLEMIIEQAKTYFFPFFTGLRNNHKECSILKNVLQQLRALTVK